jgi:hypothetical protein
MKNVPFADVAEPPQSYFRPPLAVAAAVLPLKAQAE